MTNLAHTPIKFLYRNYKGELAAREAIVHRFWFGATQWHPQQQWFMDGFVQGKGIRSFALADCDFSIQEHFELDNPPIINARMIIDSIREDENIYSWEENKLGICVDGYIDCKKLATNLNKRLQNEKSAEAGQQQEPASTDTSTEEAPPVERN